ncbi:ATP-binding cassette domain-containing protein [Marinomonas sp. GJ51-6]|uniref:ATP-binding cassette domain-containing protein n=1 Tax=Marinomonas sp. GJ51-6 TaxID=2992802 RepID=UPI0029348BFB|nr:ATP-binding cassette domain-containing protein [Marinomonas sp. GJ51-6]WOD06639.1 ATP-binding cassette domain-containing protein [Marinomonas sp. GJ51-6]
MTSTNTDNQTTSPLIEINGLYKIFGSKEHSILPMLETGKNKKDILAETGHTVGLRDINLDVHQGEIFVIMGLSGSGKSTLIRHFNRLIDPTSGQIKVEGEDIMKLSKEELIEFRRHKMSMVFQNFGLLPHRTVLENVAYGLQIQKVPKKERSEKAVKWLATVGLAGYEEQYPGQLSGGQQQRVGLARGSLY